MARAQQPVVSELDVTVDREGVVRVPNVADGAWIVIEKATLERLLTQVVGFVFTDAISDYNAGDDGDEPAG